MKFKVGDYVVFTDKFGHHIPHLVKDNKARMIVNIVGGEDCYVLDGLRDNFFREEELELVNEKNTELTIDTTGITICKQFYPQEIKINIMPDRYIINKGATILFWGDGTKTIVKRSKDDEYNKRLGFLTAYFQKMSGMSKTKANKYLDELVEKDKEIKTTPNIKVTNKNFKIEKDGTIKIDKIEPLDENKCTYSKYKTKKYKVGDKVKVINTGSLYTGYANWFEKNNCKELAKYFDLRQYPDTTKICKIIAIGNHDWNKNQIILAIRPLYSKKIYLIGQEGVEKV